MLDIMRSVTSDDEPELKEVIDGGSIIEFQHVVRRIPVADHIFEYAAALVRATRPDEPEAPEFVKKYIAWGAGNVVISMVFVANAIVSYGTMNSPNKQASRARVTPTALPPTPAFPQAPFLPVPRQPAPRESEARCRRHGLDHLDENTSKMRNRMRRGVTFADTLTPLRRSRINYSAPTASHL